MSKSLPPKNSRYYVEDRKKHAVGHRKRNTLQAMPWHGPGKNLKKVCLFSLCSLLHINGTLKKTISMYGINKCILCNKRTKILCS